MVVLGKLRDSYYIFEIVGLGGIIGNFGFECVCFFFGYECVSLFRGLFFLYFVWFGVNDGGRYFFMDGKCLFFREFFSMGDVRCELL